MRVNAHTRARELDRRKWLEMAIFYVPPSPKEREAREEEWDRMFEEAKREVA